MASKAAKIFLIGCGGLLVLTIIAMVVGGYFVKQWGTAKLKEFQNAAGTEGSEYAKKREELSRKYPFTPPDDGTITESQLVRFLNVRRQVHETYSQYRDKFKDSSRSRDSYKFAFQGIGMWKEMRMTQASALESQKMSPEEYEYLVKSVYKSWLAKGAQENLNDGSLKDTAAEGLDKAIAGIDEQLKDPDLNETVKENLVELRKKLEEKKGDWTNAKSLQEMEKEIHSVPDQNIELFKKYQKEIDQYSMGGLEFIGL